MPPRRPGSAHAPTSNAAPARLTPHPTLFEGVQLAPSQHPKRSPQIDPPNPRRDLLFWGASAGGVEAPNLGCSCHPNDRVGEGPNPGRQWGRERRQHAPPTRPSNDPLKRSLSQRTRHPNPGPNSYPRERPADTPSAPLFATRKRPPRKLRDGPSWGCHITRNPCSWRPSLPPPLAPPNPCPQRGPLTTRVEWCRSEPSARCRRPCREH